LRRDEDAEKLRAMEDPPQPTSVSASGSPWQGDDPSRRDNATTARRAMGQSVVILLAGTIVASVIGGWPVLAGAIEGDRPVAARRGLQRVFRAREWAIGKERPVREQHRMFGLDPRRRMRGPVPSVILEQLLEDAESHGGLGLMGRQVQPRGQVKIKEAPTAGAPTIYVVDKRVRMTVLKDTGRWLMVAVREEGRDFVGWAPRDTVTPLP